MRKPYFKKSHKRWYVRFEGKDVPLGEDETQAFRKWSAMVEAGRMLGDPQMKLFVLVNAFLNDQDGLLSPERLSLVEFYLSQLSASHGNTLASELTKGDVVRWVNSRDSWGEWAKHDAIACAKRMFNWAVDAGHMQRNPLKGLSNPEPASRQRVLTQDEHQRLVQASRESKQNGEAFALYLIASRCGARPQQIRTVTASHVVGSSWVFENHKTRKKTGKPLVVYLHPCLATLCSMLRRKYPEGPLFRQDNGAPWTKDVAGRKFKRLREKLGIDSDVVLYSYRHTFATDALEAGNSEHIVAKLLGHTDTRMVSRVYGHVDGSHMIEAVARMFKREHP
jgi:integrase